MLIENNLFYKSSIIVDIPMRRCQYSSVYSVCVCYIDVSFILPQACQHSFMYIHRTMPVFH